MAAPPAAPPAGAAPTPAVIVPGRRGTMRPQIPAAPCRVPGWMASRSERASRATPCTPDMPVAWEPSACMAAAHCGDLIVATVASSACLPSLTPSAARRPPAYSVGINETISTPAAVTAAAGSLRRTACIVSRKGISPRSNSAICSCGVWPRAASRRASISLRKAAARRASRVVRSPAASSVRVSRVRNGGCMPRANAASPNTMRRLAWTQSSMETSAGNSRGGAFFEDRKKRRSAPADRTVYT